MKKIIAIVLALTLALSLGAVALADDTVTLKVGASPTPHAEILEFVKPILAEQGIDLEIVEYEDYVQPNEAVESGDLDANYFQHKPYMDSFNEDNGTHLVSVGPVHYEPFGIYAGKAASIEELPEGGVIAIPNDPSNQRRALFLLQQEGIISIDPELTPTDDVTIYDVVDNPLDVELLEMEAAQITNALEDVDLAVINGNYAILGGLKASDALAVEDATGDVAITYANILCVKEGNETNEAVLALLEALQSEEVAQFIDETYEGSVVVMTGADAEAEVEEPAEEPAA